MKIVGVICLLLASLPASFAASKEMIELQRDVSQLQDQVRTLQKSLDQLTVVVQQTYNTGDKANTSIAVMQNNLSDAIKRVQEMVAQPVLGLSTKVDAMSEDFRNLRETVNDLNTRIGKLDAKMTDLGNAITVIRQPAPPPAATGVGTNGQPLATPGSAPTAGSLPPATAGPVAPPAGMQAESLYSNAYRDYLGGNYDLALSEFNDYIKYFNETQFAPNSQFYIGNIYYKKQDYPNALQAFDAVLEHYTDNSKTPGAHYWKGKTLLAMGKRDAAAKEFREILSKYPDSDVAASAKTELRSLGLSANTGAAPRRSRR